METKEHDDDEAVRQQQLGNKERYCDSRDVSGGNNTGTLSEHPALVTRRASATSQSTGSRGAIVLDAQANDDLVNNINVNERRTRAQTEKDEGYCLPRAGGSTCYERSGSSSSSSITILQRSSSTMSSRSAGGTNMIATSSSSAPGAERDVHSGSSSSNPTAAATTSTFRGTAVVVNMACIDANIEEQGRRLKAGAAVASCTSPSSTLRRARSSPINWSSSSAVDMVKGGAGSPAARGVGSARAHGATPAPRRALRTWQRPRRRHRRCGPS